MAKSKVIKLDGSLFRYDFETSVVEYIVKASKEEIEEEKMWKQKYGHGLLDIDEKGYIVLSAVGLHVSNWKDKEARNEYLSEWLAELREETEHLVSDFIKCNAN